MPSVRFVERFDLTTPRFALAIIDLAQIQNRTLHHTTTRTASAFDNAPVPVLLAVLPSPCESQVHGPRFYAQTKSRKEGRSSLHAFPPHRPLKRFSFRRQNSKIGAPVGKVGVAFGGSDPDPHRLRRDLVRGQHAGEPVFAHRLAGFAHSAHGRPSFSTRCLTSASEA